MEWLMLNLESCVTRRARLVHNSIFLLEETRYGIFVNCCRTTYGVVVDTQLHKLYVRVYALFLL